MVLRKYVIFALLVLFLSACSTVDKNENINEEISSINDGNMRDTREETTDAQVLPPFLKNHSEDMKIIYQAVAEHQDLLEHIPCYCGCNDSVGHEHNYHCFIHDTKDTGAVVWDDHATRCQVCLDIAVESIVEYDNGKTINEIRDEIDGKYEGKGYPESTPTKRYSS